MVFISIEGIDGSGKSTIINQISEYFRESGLTTYLTKEPTDNFIGKQIRQCLKQKDQCTPEMHALLFAADRNHHQIELKKAINEYDVVLTDRYIDSSIAYQMAQSIEESWIRAINKNIILPDLVLLLDINPSISLKRRYANTGQEDLEIFEDHEFLRKVRRNFLKLSEKENRYPFAIIDASKSISECMSKITEELDKLINR